MFDNNCINTKSTQILAYVDDIDIVQILKNMNLNPNARKQGVWTLKMLQSSIKSEQSLTTKITHRRKFIEGDFIHL